MLLRLRSKIHQPAKLPAVALTTYQIGLAMVFLFMTTSLDGIGAVSNDTGTWIGLIFGLGLLRHGSGLRHLLLHR